MPFLFGATVARCADVKKKGPALCESGFWAEERRKAAYKGGPERRDDRSTSIRG